MAWSTECLGFYEDSNYQISLIYLLSLTLDLDEVTVVSFAARRDGCLVTTWKSGSRLIPVYKEERGGMLGSNERKLESCYQEARTRPVR